MSETYNASRTNESLGITQRTTPLTIPWTGELRVRFTDFLVNEIAEDGKVLHLTEIVSIDEQPQPSSEGNAANGKQEQDAPQESKPPQGGKAAVEVSPEDQASLVSLAGEAFVRGCIELLKPSQQESESSGNKSVAAEPTDDRSRRVQIHQEVRRIFNSRLETSTDDSGAIVATVFEHRRGKKRGRKSGRRPPPGANEQPVGEYLHFTMYKENRDTMDAVNQIARMLRIKPQVIGYAGTKDRRAATTQRLSIRHMRDRALAGINSKLRGIYTGSYEYKNHALHLGQLAGNEFVITIKNCRLVDGGETDAAGSVKSTEDKVKLLDSSVQPALSYMAEHGWINYFGHQRFGTHGIGTHEIGKLILGDKLEEAVTALLTFDPEIAARAEAGGNIDDETSERDIVLRHQACMLFMTGKDRERAEELMPRRFTAENCILRHLNRAGAQSRRDFVGAIVHITRGLRTMYLHAYQSYVWNHVASQRWERHGSQVVKGDLVVVEDDEPTANPPTQDQDGGDIVNPTEFDDERPVRARPLTEEEAASGRYTIQDIVLPSPGYEVIYPDNDTGAFYTEFMAREENGSLDPDSMRRIKREFSLPGRYRKLVNVFIGQPSVEVKVYSNDTDQLHPTDLDLVRQAKADDGGDAPTSKRPKTEESGSKSEEQDTAMLEPGGGTEEVTQKISVTVKFQLRSSAYATVALRELMGGDISFSKSNKE